MPDLRNVENEPGSHPGPNCPSWCEKCPEPPGPPGAHDHNGHAVAASGWNGWEEVNIAVKPAHFEVPKPRKGERPEATEPHVELEGSMLGDPVSFTVANARQLAHAITVAADAIDNERQSGVNQTE